MRSDGRGRSMIAQAALRWRHIDRNKRLRRAYR